MDAVSVKDCGSSLRILKRYLEEEDSREGPLGLISMLNRQVRLLWQVKGVMLKRGGVQEVQKKRGLAAFRQRSCLNRLRAGKRKNCGVHWSDFVGLTTV